MLEITNIRNGAVLNHANGKETGKSLEISVEGIADADAAVQVNGSAALRSGKKFSAPVNLTAKFNEIVVDAKNRYGEIRHKINVVWDKKSFKRYDFFIDDNVFFLTDIAKQTPVSLFEHFYLKALKDVNKKYGTKFTLNLFYRNDHFPFEIKDFPDRYKAEWKDNSDWLKLAFHAYSEFPDRPYQHAPEEKLAADYDQLKDEVIRFAGEETFTPPEVIHWGMVLPDNISVLTERGVKVLSGSFIDSKTFVGEEDKKRRITDIGYYRDMDTSLYLESNRVLYDDDLDVFFSRGDLCCNLTPMENIPGQINIACSNPFYNETIGLVTHEQYSFDYYFNYMPDHLKRIELAAKEVSERGYKPVFFNDGILGNTAWD